MQWSRIWERVYRSRFFDIDNGWGEWSDSSPGPFAPEENVPLDHRIEDRIGLDDEKEMRKFLAIPGVEVRYLDSPTCYQSP
jgi:hypothetical protein